MQEMSPAELEDTCGGVDVKNTWQEIGSLIGQGIDSLIAAVKAIGVGLKNLFADFKGLFG